MANRKSEIIEAEIVSSEVSLQENQGELAKIPPRFLELKERLFTPAPPVFILGDDDSYILGQIMRFGQAGLKFNKEDQLTPIIVMKVAECRGFTQNEKKELVPADFPMHSVVSLFITQTALLQECIKQRPNPGEIIGIASHGRAMSKNGTEYIKVTFEIDRASSDSFWSQFKVAGQGDVL